MKERPIIFSAPMVSAILDGRKTVTRRVVKFPNDGSWEPGKLASSWVDQADTIGTYPTIIHCPYGAPGDRLWVREAWAADRCYDNMAPRYLKPKFPIYYESSIKRFTRGWHKVRPSIHMPRWASRITLEVVSVRVERVQEITEDDAAMEGVEFQDDHKDAWSGWKSADGSVLFDTAKRAFQDLWEAINGKRYPWESNPWVFVVEFKVIKPADLRVREMP